MNGTESDQIRLIGRIVEGLKQKPAYLLLFGILVLFMFMVIGLAVRFENNNTFVIVSLGMILVALLVAAYVIKTVEMAGRVPERQRDVMKQLLALGTDEDIPIGRTKAKRWAKRWNCRWTYLSDSGRLLPYVRDNIIFDIDRIDTEDGLIRGRGESPYRGGSTYDIFGRISKRDMALMFYRFRGELEALMGVLILRMRTGGSVHGWWLGIGKENMDIGGRFTWEEAGADPDFEPRVYEVSEDPPLDSTLL